MPDISIGRLRGGYCVYWHDDTGRRRYQLEARTRKEAESEAIAVYRQKTAASISVATVASIWADYVRDLGDKPTAKTMGYTGKAILPAFGHMAPEQIDRTACRAYAAAREAAGISQGSIWTELGHLQSALNYGKKTRLYAGETVHVWRPPKPDPEKRILNAGEARRLIEHASAPHIRLALILLLGTGARVGAVLDLTWDRVDFERNCINLRIADSKTRKGRAIVPMNASVRAALATAREAALSDSVIEYAGGPVACIRNGVSAAVRRARLGHVTIHELRHTAAVHMLGAGVPLEKVSQVLGHSNTAVTFRTYARYLPNQMDDAVAALDFMNLRRVPK